VGCHHYEKSLFLSKLTSYWTFLLENPKIPSKIKQETKLHFNIASRAIIELEKKELIKCLNPTQKLSRFYQITNKGKQILKEISKL
jgi:predicted transcriptional regulator